MHCFNLARISSVSHTLSWKVVDCMYLCKKNYCSRTIFKEVSLKCTKLILIYTSWKGDNCTVVLKIKTETPNLGGGGGGILIFALSINSWTKEQKIT